MTQSASHPHGDEPDWPLSWLPEEARAERADLLDHLRAVLQPEERLDVVAGADSPDAGIIALTSWRLLYVHLSETRHRFKLRQELRCATFARSDLRGARSDDRGLAVLRHKQPPLRFRNFVPPEACDLLASALGPPPIDQWTDELDECNAGLRDHFNSQLPATESIIGVAATLDGSAILGMTDSTCVLVFVENGQFGQNSWPRERLPWDVMDTVPQQWEQALCTIYERAADWKTLLYASSRSRFVGAALYKARALTESGLTDAALVAYDDAIREGKQTNLKLQCLARYNKATFLINMGDLAQARRELARLYADDPTYEDDAGLLEIVKIGSSQSGREPIPEQVRHAVWRRDQGRCVQCGGQENLEFDHIIPVSRGGANTERNLQLLCESCNRRKGATI